jgi:hypothetical protein
MRMITLPFCSGGSTAPSTLPTDLSGVLADIERKVIHPVVVERNRTSQT